MNRNNSQQNTKVGKVVRSLRQAILAGDIAPGEWLRQDELAEAFEVSPTPVREAFRHLEAEGLVEHIPHRGVRAVAYDLSVAQDYYELRALLEPHVLRKAGENLDDDGIVLLEALMQRAESCLQQQDVLGLTEVNWAFHRELVRLCGSRLEQDVLTFLTHTFQLDTLLMMPERARASYEEHEAILEALKEGDAEKAATIMRTNILNAREAMVSRLPSLGKRADGRRAF